MPINTKAPRKTSQGSVNLKNISPFLDLTKDIRGALDGAIEEVGKFMKYEAWKRCPVDTGHLQSHIYPFGKTYGLDNGPITAETFKTAWGYRISLGIRAGSSRNPKHKKLRAVDYAYYVHEFMAPWGKGDRVMLPGPLSRAKASQYNVVVGGGFLTRAIEDNRQNMNDIILNHLAKVAKK